MKKTEEKKIVENKDRLGLEKRKPSFWASHKAMKLVSNFFLLVLVIAVFVFGFYVGAMYKDLQIRNAQTELIKS